MTDLKIDQSSHDENTMSCYLISWCDCDVLLSEGSECKICQLNRSCWLVSIRVTCRHKPNLRVTWQPVASYSLWCDFRLMFYTVLYCLLSSSVVLLSSTVLLFETKEEFLTAAKLKESLHSAQQSQQHHELCLKCEAETVKQLTCLLQESIEAVYIVHCAVTWDWSGSSVDFIYNTH